MTSQPLAGWWIRRTIVALVLVLGTGAMYCGIAGAQTAPDSTAAPARPATVARPAVPVAGVEIQGRVRVDSLRIVRAFEVRPGSPWDARAVQAGLRRLWATNLFDDLRVDGRTAPDGVHLVLTVTERPHVASVTFEGVKKFKESELAEHVGIRPGDSWRPYLLAAAQDSILARYRGEGYRETRVSATADSGAGGMRVRFAVTEGRKARVTAIAFEGNHAFDDGELRGKLASKKKGFLFRSGTVKEENLDKDLDRLRTFYRAHGYRDVEVERLPFRADSSGGGLVLAYQVNEGPLYHVGEVRWQGNSTVPTPRLEALSRGLAGAEYDGTAIRKAVEDAYSMYAEEGYLYLSVDPTETVRDSNRVDLAFQVSEGPPSHVRQVRITGNTYTKENVVRRELSLREGDLFRRSLLVRSQQDVFRLGYFQDVGVDFQPADSSDVDIVLKIKEKQTGTASAGAGYSSDGGLSGFLNLGHNNLFGNGQAISIQLERGSSRRSVDLSFTDPWFHNTPLTLGGSAFSTYRDIGTTDITTYTEKRRGFSVTVGRPIPGLHYTRGLARYQLEGVRIAIPDPSLASPQLLAIQTEGEQVTSSIELSLTRNSTNHPTYPNRGQRGTISTEFAGGPLGGDFDFNKTRIDSRWYRGSILPRVASMLRLRLGSLNSYAGGRDVPVYERFRLGGVTYDALRGYDDYSVVPQENDTYPRYSNGSAVTLGGFAGGRVPYPGGRVFGIVTFEQQFPIVDPVHGVLFAEGGNTWNRLGDVRPFHLRKSAGLGLRLEIPILGNVGFDYAYGFDRDVPGWKGHFLLGAFQF